MSDETELHQSKLRLAYKLWQEAGSPWGRDAEFWELAEQQMALANTVNADLNDGSAYPADPLARTPEPDGLDDDPLPEMSNASDPLRQPLPRGGAV
jgi:hypothetical protein